MTNILKSGLPDNYHGFKINSGYRTALDIMEILEDPRINKQSTVERLAAYMAAISLLFVDSDVYTQDKLGLDDAINGLFWFLNCGNNDNVLNYWKRTGIAPDVDDNAFDINEYNDGAADTVVIEQDVNGKKTLKEVSRYSILSFNAPDGTVRYIKRANGEPDLVSLFEDADLIYSGFYRVFGIDLSVDNIHWFKFSVLLAELEATEGTLLANKIKLRSFDANNYKGKQYKDFVAKMLKARYESRVLGILPYIDRSD